MVRYLFILIMVLIVNLGIFAQGSLPNRYHASYLNMASGMPNNFADDIFQDSYGYMWISTHGGGLVRYDGYDFLNFGLGAIGVQLRSNNCRNVYEDSFRRLWIAFEEGPQVLDLKTMQAIVPPCENEALAQKLSKALKQFCTRMYCDSKGNMWMLSQVGIYRFAFNEKGRSTASCLLLVLSMLQIWGYVMCMARELSLSAMRVKLVSFM